LQRPGTKTEHESGTAFNDACAAGGDKDREIEDLFMPIG